MKILPVQHYFQHKIYTGAPKKSQQDVPIKYNNTFSSATNAISSYFMPFMGKAEPIYSIDRKMGLRPFKSANAAGKELEVPTPGVLKCLSGKAKYAGAYAFTYAKNIEIIGKDGKITYDEEKIKQIFEAAEYARKYGANVCKRVVLALDKEYELHRYDSVTDAAKATGAGRPNISGCLNGNKNSTGGYVFFDPEEIYVDGKDGEVDEEKFKKAVQKAKEAFENPYAADIIKLYALHKDGTRKKFEKLKEATDALPVSYEAIKACLSGKTKFAGDYTFTLPEEIEIVKEDGTIDIDEEKVKELLKAAQIARENNKSARGKALISVKVDDMTQRSRFDKSADAAKGLEITPIQISTCLSGKNKTAGGYYIILAERVEYTDKNGVIQVDEEKLKNIIEEIKNSGGRKASTKPGTKASAKGGAKKKGASAGKKAGAKAAEKVKVETKNPDETKTETQNLETEAKPVPLKVKTLLALPAGERRLALPEPKRLPALPEPEHRLALPEPERRLALPEPKHLLALPEPKRRLALPEPKCLPALPEPERRLALPEAKRTLALPEAKPEQTQPKAAQPAQPTLKPAQTTPKQAPKTTESNQATPKPPQTAPKTVSKAAPKPKEKPEAKTVKSAPKTTATSVQTAPKPAQTTPKPQAKKPAATKAITSKTAKAKNEKPKKKRKNFGRIYALNANGDIREYKDFDTAVAEFGISPKQLHAQLVSSSTPYNGWFFSCDLDN